MKKGSAGITILIILIIIGLAIGVYFIFFTEKCSKDQIFDPYKKMCVGKIILCNLGIDCILLEGQTASFPGESLTFTLISAEEAQTGSDRATINIGGLGETNLISGDEFSFEDYTIILESADGDADKIMGAGFEVVKS